MMNVRSPDDLASSKDERERERERERETTFVRFATPGLIFPLPC